MVMNPQRMRGQRITAAALQPSVVEFLVVMHAVSLEESNGARRPSAPAGRTPSGGECGRDDPRLCWRSAAVTEHSWPIYRWTPSTC
jgi:hypothetical protein